MNISGTRLLFSVVLCVGLAGTYWYLQGDASPRGTDPIVVPPTHAASDEPTVVSPRHPIASSTSPQRDLVPLPALDDSDGYFLLALLDIFGPDLETVVVNKALVDNVVATIDNLPRPHVAGKIRPIGRLPDIFLADAAGADDLYILNPDSFARYDLLVDLLTSADLDRVAETYRRFYPLFQESYLRLGYPSGYFNDRVVGVIDQLLMTPEAHEPIVLTRPHVLYEFADAELEALSSGEKLLIRMGTDHAASIKQVLHDFRLLIASPPGVDQQAD